LLVLLEKIKITL